ncbi:MAG: FecR domain-containing protein [Sinobacteraceae bacterium]|nr:FecR domain-containing protein [Nevskiaceae bacterium]
MLSRMLRVKTAALSVGVLLVFAGQAYADEDDPPTRAARLSVAEGSVSFEPAGTQDWVTATLNRPLTNGDKIWDDRDSRSEIQLDGSTLRLSSESAAAILDLSDTVTQIQLTAGTLIVRVRRLDDHETYEIDTPNLAFSVLRPGTYRLSVNDAGDATTIRVHEGQGEVTGGGSAVSIRPDEFDIFSGTDQLTQDQPPAPAQDDFDNWSERRDTRWARSASARYVSPDVVGYEDLDDNGAWQSVPEYGQVWFPHRVAPGWAPYHTGHWSYVPPWGYTWIDDEPWGYAPFHYGRWVSYHDTWGWVPAPPPRPEEPYVHPVYAPALVAWVGVGAGVAWFALGPREVYVPSYPVSRTYINNVNVSNTTVNNMVINNVYNTTIVNNKTVVNNITYVNRTVPGAVAVTSQQAFTSAQPVARNLIKVDQRSLTAAPVRALTPPIVPTKQALLGVGHNTAPPPAKVANRAVVARVAPPAPPPSFESRQAAIRSNAGKPLSMTQVRQIQSAQPQRPAVRVAPPATPRPPAAAGAGPTTHPTEQRVQPPPPASRPAASPPSASPPPASPPSASRPAASPPPASQGRSDRPPGAAAAVPRTPPNPNAVHANELPRPEKPAPAATANSALERQQLQAQQQLEARQQQAREQLQRQQQADHQKQHEEQQAEHQRQQQAQQAQQQAEHQRQQQEQQRQAQARQQQLEQQHQQQTQALQQQHEQQRQQLQQHQDEERRQQESQSRPPARKNDRPPGAH